MTKPLIPLCRPDYGPDESRNVARALKSGKLDGGGAWTKRCEQTLEAATQCHRALLVPSCTAALEMMALALDIQPGDEIIMPSFTFVSTANAIALRGGVPVFVDVEAETLNIDPVEIARAITPKTRAVMVVHYAGVACDMAAIASLCEAHNLNLLEDAAQAFGASWRGQALGTFGTFGAISFHHTKNVTCGEGGALLINDPNYVSRCEIIRDKGTDRAEFLRGTRNHYAWQGLGSSFLLGELSAALLSAQLGRSETLTRARRQRWERYHAAFRDMDKIKVPHIPEEAEHNGHIYHIRFSTAQAAKDFQSYCVSQGIVAAPHYVALHDSAAGQALGRSVGALPHTRDGTQNLIRLPLYSTLSEADQSRVIKTVQAYLDTL